MLAGMAVEQSARERTGSGNGSNVPGGNVYVMYATKAKVSLSVLWSDALHRYVRTVNVVANNVGPSHVTNIGQFMGVIAEDF